MDKVQKAKQGLAILTSENLLKISPNDFHLSIQKEFDQARKEVNEKFVEEIEGKGDDERMAIAKKYDKEYENKLVVISQRAALARADIDDEWIIRCKTPKNTKKELVKCTTLTDAIDLLAPSLYRIKKIKSEEYVLSYLSLWIVDLQMNLNIKNTMSEDMIKNCSEAILEQFGYLTIPDVKNVFTDALSGVYGEFYESLSIPKVLRWFDEYALLRGEEFSARNYSDHSYFKNESSGWKDRRKKKQVSASDMLEIERGRE